MIEGGQQPVVVLVPQYRAFIGAAAVGKIAT
jgi:hypothetical protein